MLGDTSISPSGSPAAASKPALTKTRSGAYALAMGSGSPAAASKRARTTHELASGRGGGSRKKKRAGGAGTE